MTAFASAPGHAEPAIGARTRKEALPTDGGFPPLRIWPLFEAGQPGGCGGKTPGQAAQMVRWPVIWRRGVSVRVAPSTPKHESYLNNMKTTLS
jgi:hypothetical protein